MRHSIFWLGVFLAQVAQVAQGAESKSTEVRFARDVRPILAEHCFRCHGPDERQRKGDLRLDRESDAKRVADGHAAVVPGQPAQSELWLRARTNDPEIRMPPPDAGPALTEQQLATLRQWLEQGAAWEDHWAWTPPRRPEWGALPVVPTARSMIDVLAVADQNRETLPVYVEADRVTLIRRVTLDLTGLPPTLDEIDTFVADGSPNAYEKLVDRLLASPRYGERMAWTWLEAARYADTSGYQNDGPRSMWRWRDWVIAAFNAGMPFDQFTTEQLAGDLLPSPSLEQRIATGFNRNHRGNSEGGIIPDEYQVEYVVDRVDTTATVWLGLTLGCARCHEHKYDPLTQQDFYRVFAYFNNIPEYGRAIKEGNSPPLVAAPTSEQRRRLAELDELAKLARDRWNAIAPRLEAEIQQWRPRPDELRDDFVEAVTDPESQFPLDGRDAAEVASLAHGQWRGEAGRSVPGVPGVSGNAVQFAGAGTLDVADAGNFGYLEPFSVSVWVKPDSLERGVIVSRMTDEEEADGWAIQLSEGRVQVNLVKRWLDDAVRVESEESLPAGKWTHLAVTYDGSRFARGVQLFVNGERAKLRTRLDLLNQTFAVKEPLRIGGGGGPSGRFRGSLDTLLLAGRVLRDDEVALLATADSLATIAAIPVTQRTPRQAAKLREYFVRAVAPDEWRAAYRDYRRTQDQRDAWVATFPTVMVMEEMAKPRATHLLVRGEYNRPGDRVTPGIPAALQVGGRDFPPNRLGFAQWLTSDEHPLTARVAANRLWQLHWGVGLVKTVEDFGVQGAPPSQPELLDWLALELRGESPRNRWDIKGLQREMVTSAWYRSAAESRVALGTAAGDPTGATTRMFFPRTRWSAEVVRDQALAAAGLLVEETGGPSVKIYQPADLWKDLATDSVYERDRGAKLYRRSLYAYWKRTVAPPSLTTLDAATREACQVRSPRTNTPLQALTLLNEVTFVEAARSMAVRVLLDAGEEVAAKLPYAFRLATSRPPSEEELRVLTDLLARTRSHFSTHRDDANQLIRQGDSIPDTRCDPIELAAWTVCCNLLLNLDEVVTKQ